MSDTTVPFMKVVLGSWRLSGGGIRFSHAFIPKMTQLIGSAWYAEEKDLVTIPISISKRRAWLRT